MCHSPSSLFETLPPDKHRSWAIVDLDKAKYNFNQIKKQTNSKICCVVKANAYGHGAVRLASLYQNLGAGYLAVSNIEEALQLRKNNIFLPILVLGYTHFDCAKLLAENNISQCVYSYEYGIKLAETAEKQGVRLKVHIKIDSGMGRIGFLHRENSYTNIDDIVEICNLPNIYPEGIFTHFAVSDEGSDGEAFTRQQFKNFMETVGALKTYGVEFETKHCANSAAIFDYPEFHLDMVRAGVVLYGLKPSSKVHHLPDLKPIMNVYSVISNIKTVFAGQSVSYGRTYFSTSNREIATIPIGYADGFRRMNGEGKFCLLVHSSLAPIVGRVCMDQLMIDVTDIECKVDDAVLIFGDDEKVNVDAIAVINDTINYEIVCNLGERVPRFYLDSEKNFLTTSDGKSI